MIPWNSRGADFNLCHVVHTKDTRISFEKWAKLSPLLISTKKVVAILMKFAVLIRLCSPSSIYLVTTASTVTFIWRLEQPSSWCDWNSMFLQTRYFLQKMFANSSTVTPEEYHVSVLLRHCAEKPFCFTYFAATSTIVGNFDTIDGCPRLYLPQACLSVCPFSELATFSELGMFCSSSQTSSSLFTSCDLSQHFRRASTAPGVLTNSVKFNKSPPFSPLRNITGICFKTWSRLSSFVNGNAKFWKCCDYIFGKDFCDIG